MRTCSSSKFNMSERENYGVIQILHPCMHSTIHYCISRRRDVSTLARKRKNKKLQTFYRIMTRCSMYLVVISSPLLSVLCTIMLHFLLLTEIWLKGYEKITRRKPIVHLRIIQVTRRCTNNENDSKDRGNVVYHKKLR